MNTSTNPSKAAIHLAGYICQGALSCNLRDHDVIRSLWLRWVSGGMPVAGPNKNKIRSRISGSKARALVAKAAELQGNPRKDVVNVVADATAYAAVLADAVAAMLSDNPATK